MELSLGAGGTEPLTILMRQHGGSDSPFNLRHYRTGQTAVTPVNPQSECDAAGRRHSIKILESSRPQFQPRPPPTPDYPRTGDSPKRQLQPLRGQLVHVGADLFKRDLLGCPRPGPLQDDALIGHTKEAVNSVADGLNALLLNGVAARGFETKRERVERHGSESYTPSSKPSGQRLVLRDQSRNARQPRASTPTPKRITRNCVVAKTNIQPSRATRAGSG